MTFGYKHNTTHKHKNKTIELLPNKNEKTNFDLALLGDTTPALGMNTRPPIKIDTQRHLRLMTVGSETSHVVSSFHRGERELSRVHVFRVMKRVPVTRCHLCVCIFKYNQNPKIQKKERKDFESTLMEIL